MNNKLIYLVMFMTILLAGCSEWTSQKASGSISTVHQTINPDVAKKLQNEKVLAVLQDDKMYTNIQVDGKKLNIPSWWKWTWDTLVENWKEWGCKYLESLGKEMVQYCKDEIQKRTNEWYYAKKLKEQQKLVQEQNTTEWTINEVEKAITDNCSNLQTESDKNTCYMNNGYCDKLKWDIAKKCVFKSVVKWNEQLQKTDCDVFNDEKSPYKDTNYYTQCLGHVKRWAVSTK